MKKVVYTRFKEIKVTVELSFGDDLHVISNSFPFSWSAEKMLSYILNAHGLKTYHVVDFVVSSHIKYHLK